MAGALIEKVWDFFGMDKQDNEAEDLYAPGEIPKRRTVPTDDDLEIPPFLRNNDLF